MDRLGCEVTGTHPAFWDCECPENYIHLKEDSLHCEYCDSHEDDQPDSMIDEALDFMMQRNRWLRDLISCMNGEKA